MSTHVSAAIRLPEIAGLLLAAALFVWALAASARKTALSSARKAAVVIGVAGFLALWYAAALYLASRGVFHYSSGQRFPFLAAGFMVPAAVAIAAWTWSPALRSVVQEVPQQHLIGVQVFRIIGFTLLVLMFQSVLPPQFAWPAGAGDVTVGILAAVVAVAYARRIQSAAAFGLIWNIVGIADLLNAMAIGFLASSTPFRSIFLSPTTDAMTVLPLAMIPVFGVPFFLLLHALSLRGIASASRAGALTQQPM